MLFLGCAVGGRFVEGAHVHPRRPTADQRRYYEAVRAAQQLGGEALRPGLPCARANAVCLDVIREAGLGDYLQHRQGHGIGLGMHEPPWLEDGDDTPLEAGLVVSNEPRIYIPGHAGYRMSDSMLITADGATPLTSYPKAIDDIVIAAYVPPARSTRVRHDQRQPAERRGERSKDGTLLIAHHGAPGLGSLAEPRATFGPLSDTYRVLVFDARGSGQSEGNGPLTHQQWVADVEGLREWAGADRFVIAGGSYGGFIAMEYAIRHPDRLLAMVLRDTSADHANEEMARANALSSARVDLDMSRFERIMDGATLSDADLRECWAEILPLYDHVYDPAVVARKVDATTYRYQTHNGRSPTTCRPTTSRTHWASFPARHW